MLVFESKITLTTVRGMAVLTVVRLVRETNKRRWLVIDCFVDWVRKRHILRMRRYQRSVLLAGKVDLGGGRLEQH